MYLFPCSLFSEFCSEVLNYNVRGTSLYIQLDIVTLNLVSLVRISILSTSCSHPKMVTLGHLNLQENLRIYFVYTEAFLKIYLKKIIKLITNIIKRCWHNVLSELFPSLIYGLNIFSNTGRVVL